MDCLAWSCLRDLIAACLVPGLTPTASAQTTRATGADARALVEQVVDGEVSIDLRFGNGFSRAMSRAPEAGSE